MRFVIDCGLKQERLTVNDQHAISIAIATNLLRRQDLPIIERGKAYKALLDARNHCRHALYVSLPRRKHGCSVFAAHFSYYIQLYKAGRSIDEIPVGDFFAPSLLDFTHGSYLCIDLDVFLTRQSKNRMIHKFGQQLRINRSKIKEASNTNTDFDDPGSALISTNDNHVAVEIKCSELEKELITTDRRALQESLKRNGKTG